MKTNLLIDRRIESNSCLSFWKLASSLVQPRIRGVLESKKHDLLFCALFEFCIAVWHWGFETAKGIIWYQLTELSMCLPMFAVGRIGVPEALQSYFTNKNQTPGLSWHRQGFNLRGILWQLAVSVVSLIFFEP